MDRTAILQTFNNLTTPIIYLMGISFILGSLCTILLLLLLDMVKANKNKGQKP